MLQILVCFLFERSRSQYVPLLRLIYKFSKVLKRCILYIGSFNKRAGFQSLGKFLFVALSGYFFIVSVSLNIPIDASV